MTFNMKEFLADFDPKKITMHFKLSDPDKTKIKLEKLKAESTENSYANNLQVDQGILKFTGDIKSVKEFSETLLSIAGNDIDPTNVYKVDLWAKAASVLRLAEDFSPEKDASQNKSSRVICVSVAKIYHTFSKAFEKANTDEEERLLSDTSTKLLEDIVSIIKPVNVELVDINSL